MNNLPKRLRITASMIALGEMISWGSDTALMEEAADVIEALSAILAAPRQPEGDGLEVVANQFPEINFSNYGQDEVEALQAWGFTALDAMADAQRAIAERDAEIMEQCRLNGMGAERELKLLTQRDKLAGLLREALPYTNYCEDDGRTRRRIEAALVEVKGQEAVE